MPRCFSSARMASLALRPYFSRRASLPTAWISSGGVLAFFFFGPVRLGGARC